MFGRSRKQKNGFGSKQQSQQLQPSSRSGDQQVDTLRELGILNSTSQRHNSRRADGTRTPYSPNGGGGTPYVGGTGAGANSYPSSFPEKGHSIAARTLARAPHSSAASISSTRSKDSMSTITGLTSDRNRSRRERTFVGSECAVCEEPLEHTLRGERILQFSCSHVSHEACFYEFIREFESQYCPTCNAPLHLDTSRSGNVIDIGR
jgi:hypothetical protein